MTEFSWTRVDDGEVGTEQLLAGEGAAIRAGAAACGARCACHGDVRCLRAVHAHVAGDASPHVGRDAFGELLQWVHTEAEGPMLTGAEVAEQLAAARREVTRKLIDGIDLSELRKALAEFDAEPNTGPAKHGTA